MWVLTVERVASSFEGLLRFLADPDEQALHSLSFIYLMKLALAQLTPDYKKQVEDLDFLSRLGSLPESLYAKATSFTGCQCYRSFRPVMEGKSLSTEKSPISTLFILEDEEENDKFYEI